MSVLPTLAVYLDQDGVLADFEEAAARFLNMPPAALRNLNVRHDRLLPEGRLIKERLYEHMRQVPQFYEHLSLMPGALEMYERFTPYAPVILTAAPGVFQSDESAVKTVRKAKWKWCQEGLGMQNPTDFVCMVNESKGHYVGLVEADVQLLVDDRLENCADWIDAGGIAIHHKDSSDTIAQFEAMIASDGPFAPHS